MGRAQDAARDQCGIKILDPLPYLCHGGCRYGSKNGRPIYVDDDHLSEFGNKLLAPMFATVFNALSPAALARTSGIPGGAVAGAVR